jgi:hypothetical protein
LIVDVDGRSVMMMVSPPEAVTDVIKMAAAALDRPAVAAGG